MRHDTGRSRAVIGLLVLACVTIMTLDGRHDTTSPVDPLRTAVGEVLGPVEDGANAVVHPITSIPDHFGDISDLRRRNAALQRQNDLLRSRLNAQAANRYRAQETQTIGAFADTHGFRVVQAQVIGMGSAQSFSRTVTIDAGTSDGVFPDLTVINANGLVGRVVQASSSTATVLLAVDRDSTVGCRLSSSMELGFLTGTGSLYGAGGLRLSLVDHTIAPKTGDTVLTWGSRSGAPYLPGIPIGRVTEVHSSPVDLTETATVEPYVDFTSLDVVGVVTSADGSTGHTTDAAAR